MIDVLTLLTWSPAALEDVADRIVEQRRLVIDQLVDLDEGAPSAAWEGVTATSAREVHNGLHSTLEGLYLQMERVATAVEACADSLRRAQRLALEAVDMAKAQEFSLNLATLQGIAPEALDAVDPEKLSERQAAYDRIVDRFEQAIRQAQQADQELAQVLTAAAASQPDWRELPGFPDSRTFLEHAWNFAFSWEGFAVIGRNYLNRRDLLRSEADLRSIRAKQRAEWTRNLQKYHALIDKALADIRRAGAIHRSGPLTRWVQGLPLIGRAMQWAQTFPSISRFTRWVQRSLPSARRRNLLRTSLLKEASESFQKANQYLVMPLQKKVAAKRAVRDQAEQMYRTVASRQLPPRLASRLAGVAPALKVGSRLLGGAGVAVSLWQTGSAVHDRDWGQAAASTASAVGGAGLLFAATLGPPGAVVAGVLVAGSLAYEYRDELGRAARWVDDRVANIDQAIKDRVQEATDNAVANVVSGGRRLLAATPFA